jgi:hypothetical protein
MLKASLTKKNQAHNLIEDVFWRGIAYSDKCKAEKEMKQTAEKEKIKSDIQSRKLKTGTNSSFGLPPGGGAKRGRGVGLQA